MSSNVACDAFRSVSDVSRNFTRNQKRPSLLLLQQPDPPCSRPLRVIPPRITKIPHGPLLAPPARMHIPPPGGPFKPAELLRRTPAAKASSRRDEPSGVSRR